jgi:hypothetical protein
VGIEAPDSVRIVRGEVARRETENGASGGDTNEAILIATNEASLETVPGRGDEEGDEEAVVTLCPSGAASREMAALSIHAV